MNDKKTNQNKSQNPSASNKKKSGSNKAQQKSVSTKSKTANASANKKQTNSAKTTQKTSQQNPKDKQKNLTTTSESSLSATTLEQPVAEQSTNEMSIVKNFLKCYKKYFTFSGRSSRYEYFSFALVFYLVRVVLGASSIFHPIFSFLSLAFLLLSIIPSFSVLNRRLHDINRNLWNGYFNWMFYGIGVGVVIGTIIYFGFGKNSLPMINIAFASSTSIFALFCLASLIRLLILICRRGQNVENKYGKIPVLDNPTAEKSAFKLIIIYFTTVLVIAILNFALGYFEMMNPAKKLDHTNAQLTQVENYILYIGSIEGNYDWLDNGVALRQPLITEDMFTSDRRGITTALGLPVLLFGFNDIFVISLQNVDVKACKLITPYKWQFQNIDEMMIRNDYVEPTIQETLVNIDQCNVCANGLCEIFWKLK